MIQSQIISRGVTGNSVISAMRRVDRKSFVPSRCSSEIYMDNPLPIGRGQTISQPYIVAYMTEKLQLFPKMKVLEIGTGSGYQSAILAEFDIELHTIEADKYLAESAQKRLTALGYGNIRFYHGSGYEGLSEEAPFDRIMVTCAPAQTPPALLTQLADRGILIIPTGRGIQILKRIERLGTSYKEENLLHVRFVPMV